MRFRQRAVRIVNKYLGEDASEYNELINDITDALRVVQKQSDYDDSEEFEENLVFVVMPFTGDDMEEVYSAIKDECSKLGLKTKRVDENPGSGLVINEITELIIKAEFIICDLTSERPNVYYELGLAHGVGNEPLDVFLIAKQGTILHFDIAPFRVRYYRTTEHLRGLIQTNFKEMVRASRESEGRA